MQIVIMASGTRGDVQPILALGQRLLAAGHKVRVVAGSNFSDWIEGHGLEAYATVDMEALMQSEEGVKWVEGSNGFAQLRAMKALMRSIDDQSIADTIDGTKGADLLIGGFVAEPFLQAISEQRSTPLVSVALQPYRATASGPASLLALRPRAVSALNRWSGRLAERISWTVAAETAGKLRARLGLPAHTAASYVRAARSVPALYAISPQIVPPVADANAHTTGYWFLDEAYDPPGELERFIAAGPAPVYIGFGSMPTSDPAGTLRVIGEALALAGLRGIVGRGWGGSLAADLPDHLRQVDSVPHSWLFPRMAAVVHHGGAGTTAAGLRAGKPTLVVPHMADQPYWARRVRELGVGPQPLPRSKVGVESLAGRLSTLVADSAVAGRAAALGERIRVERGLENAFDWLERFIG